MDGHPARRRPGQGASTGPTREGDPVNESKYEALRNEVVAAGGVLTVARVEELMLEDIPTLPLEGALIDVDPEPAPPAAQLRTC